MYEFDEERSDHQESQAGDVKGIVDGWLIQIATLVCETPIRSESRANESRMTLGEPLYLQLGTGQWCAAEYATFFPLHSTAATYAKEFGYVVGHDVQIVRHRF